MKKKILCGLTIILMVFMMISNICSVQAASTVESTCEYDVQSCLKEKEEIRLLQSNSLSSDDWNYVHVTTLITYYKNNYPDQSDFQIINLVYDDLFTKQRYVAGLTSEEFWVIYNELGLSGFFDVKSIAENVTNTTVEMYGINGHKDDSDAFRHIFLTSSLYQSFSKRFAENLMTAHESETTDELDKKMDLHNNSRGILLYEKWNSSIKPDALKYFITHCVSNGHFYNIKKIDSVTGTPTLIFTSIGQDNLTFGNKTMFNLSTTVHNSHMEKNDFQWYKVQSENKTGKFKIYSSGSIDLVVELYSSRFSDGIFINSDDDGGANKNFELEFNLAYYETAYVKVYGYNNDEVGDYDILVEEVSVTTTQPVSYLKYDKKKHKRVSSSVDIRLEPHAVSSDHGRYTNCVLCDELLDTYIDGPFFVMYSANSSVFMKVFDLWEIYLTQNDWKKYIEGTYFMDKGNAA